MYRRTKIEATVYPQIRVPRDRVTRGFTVCTGTAITIFKSIFKEDLFRADFQTINVLKRIIRFL